MKFNRLFIPLLLCLLFCPSCAETRETPLSSEEEQLFYNAVAGEGSDELLIKAAEGMSAPWSGLALFELSRTYLKRPVPPSLNRIYRLWKKYTGRFGYDSYSRDIRIKISLLADHDPARSPILDSGENDDFYSWLYELNRRSDSEDFSPLYGYLDRVTDEEELSFLLYYLGSRGLIDSMPAALTDWLTLKLLVHEKEYRAASDKVSRLENDPAVTGLSGYYRDVWRVVLSHPDRSGILADWESRSDILVSEPRWSLLFHSALCRRTMKHFLTSGTLLEKALDSAVTSYQYDRTLWYRLDVLDQSGGNLAEALEDRAYLWHDPAYFDDLVERAFSTSVFQARWGELLSLEQSLVNWGSPDSRDLAEWIVAQCGESGYLKLPEGGEERRYRSIASRGQGSLYTLLAEYRQGGGVSYYKTMPQGGARSTEKGDPFITGAFLGLIERDLLLAARSWYEEFGGSLSLESLRDYAYLLRRSGRYLESIRVMGAAARREDFVRSREDLALLYPLEYAGSIEYWCREYSVPEALFRALIKTESGYDKDIVSYAGAVGLSQLMPPTAEERMTLMGMEGADLTEPDVNIALGTGYLRWLFDRNYIDSTVQAAAAYNGGPGSVRKWNRTMGDYPRLLYMEGIPFTQTRDYVKSLVQGAVVYGFLYENRSPEEILADLLPELAG